MSNECPKAPADDGSISNLETDSSHSVTQANSAPRADEVGLRDSPIEKLGASVHVADPCGIPSGKENPPDAFLEWVKNNPPAEKPPKVVRNQDGKFKKGSSGNPDGRPLKRERAFVTRQLTRDVLGVTEELVTVQTPKGSTQIPAFVLALLKIRSKALAGHGPSLRKFLDLHFAAIADHAGRHKFFKELEQTEHWQVFDPRLFASKAKETNEQRKSTRRT